MPGCYMIMAGGAGDGLICQVEQDPVVVFVLAVGRRNRSLVYKIFVHLPQLGAPTLIK